MTLVSRAFATWAVWCAASGPALAQLPAVDGPIEIAAQEWPLRPGPRTVRVLVRYPGGKLERVTEKTGVMLTLHNWGGVDCVGTADPKALAERLDVVALCVNYLQSGPKDSIEGPEPYDFGYLQALDAIRAVRFVTEGLARAGRPFASGRIYATGGSGGGNVTLMANKLAPRTFACVVDLCGMAKLSDDVAFNLPGGTSLDARWSRDPKSPYHLSRDRQELHFLGHPEHLATQKRLGNDAKIVVVHGVQDTACPFAEAEEMVANMKRAGLDVEPRFVTPKDLDGKVFTSAGHALGNRTEIVFAVAGKYLTPGSPELRVRRGASDFERQDAVRYVTAGGAYVVSYRDGPPVARFEPAPAAPVYPDREDLTYVLDGERRPIRTDADAELRARHTRANLERVMGPFPGPLARVPLDVKVVSEKALGDVELREITYRSDAHGRVPAYLLLPKTTRERRPAMLVLHQTSKFGKDEPAGLRGDASLKIGLELAQRGYVVVCPDYPTFGAHAFDFAKHGYVSGSMKAIWDNVRAVDLLETLPEVDATRIGVIGHSLGGHNALFTAAFEPRLQAIVSSCGFTTFAKDDMPSWTGPVYMPRIRTEYGNDARKVPFDFPEILASLAPRAVLACAAEKDSDFAVEGVRDALRAAGPAYARRGASARLVLHAYPGPHAFPQPAREFAYRFLATHLRP